MPDTAAGVKHDDSQAVPVEIVADYTQPPSEYVSPYDAAKSFAALDALRATEAQASAISMVFYNFEMLAHNIMRDDGMSAGQKASALTALTTELETRLTAAQEDPDSAYKAEFTNPVVDPGTFVAFKDAAGEYRWTTVHTNKFRDKTGEIMSDAAHREYVDWVNENKASMPVLRFWHIPEPTPSELEAFRTLGTVPSAMLDLGKADLVAYDDSGFVLATGTFYPEMREAAERLAGMKDLACSHGYIYRGSDKVDGVIGRYKTFEVTVVPRPFEANMLTLSGVSQEGTMLSEKQREAAVGVFGESHVKALEDSMHGMAAVAAAEGVDFKAVAEALTEPEAPAAEPTLQEQIDAAVRQALAARDAAERGETVVETGVVNDDGTLTPDPATTTTVATTASTPVPVVNINGPITVTGESAPEDEGSEPVEPTPAPVVAELPTDTKALDPMAGILAAMQTIVDGAIARAVEPLSAAVLDLQSGQRALGERVAATEETTDTKVANAMRPKPIGPIATQPASTAPETEVPTEIAEAFRAQWKAAETPEAEQVEGGPLDLVGRYGLASTLQNAALFGGDAD